MIWNKDFFEVGFMTNVYQDNSANGNQTPNKENVKTNTDNSSAIPPMTNANLADLNTNKEQINEQTFKLLRQQTQQIFAQIRSASDLDTLFRTVTTEILEKIPCDRAIIYRFDSPTSGTVLAEAMTRGWTPTIGEKLSAIIFGLDEKQDYIEPFAIDDIDKSKLTAYQKQLIDKYQIQGSVCVPITLGYSVWGLLVLHNCSIPRHWSEFEITLLANIAEKIYQRLIRYDLKSKQEQQLKQQQSITKVIDKIRSYSSLSKIFQTATQEIRQLIKCDRVAVYKFNPDWSGEFIAESVGNEWIKLVDPDIKTVWEDTYLQETQGGRYRTYQNLVVNDIYQANHSPCHVEILEQFQIKAYLTIPVFSGQKLWGILAAYQNSSTREWQDWEVNLLSQFTNNFGVAINQAEYLQEVQQTAEQEKTLAKVVHRIRKSLDLDTVFKTTTQEVRQLLQCDRVGVYRFNPDWSGQFVAESVAQGWTPFMDKEFDKDQLQEASNCSIQRLATGKKVQDTYLQDTEGGRYQNKEYYVVNNIYKAGFPNCYLSVLEEFQAKAYVTFPIFKGDKLWGLLAAYQNSDFREWQEAEINLMRQISVQFGLAVSQAEYIQQTQEQSQKLARTAERQQDLMALTKKIGEALIEKVTDSSQLNAILQTTVAEVRKLLQADRTVVYKFKPDWSGDFIAESVGAGWLTFTEKNIDQNLLKENGHCDSIRNMASIYKAKDSYLQDNQGGRYQQKTAFVVNDVSKAGFPSCYKDLLDQFEAKAYLTVPIYKSDKLWGLLASYQHSGTREWQEAEITVMKQIAVLLAVAMQQAETFEKLQQQTQRVAKAAELDRAFARISEKIRDSLDIETIFSSSTKEIRSLLSAERVAVYRINPDWSGLFVSESVAPGWVALVDKQNQIKGLQESISVCSAMKNLAQSSQADTYLQSTLGGELRNRKTYVRNDIYKAGFSECYIEVLEQYQCKAYVIVPIFQGQKLWEMLAAYQNSAAREWQEAEVNLLEKIGNQLGVALLQAEYLQQLEQQSKQLAEAAAREKEAKEFFQKAAMQVLAAVRPALNGDLTVRAPVTEDVLGTIADSYNNTLQALRQIVMQVQTASQQVAQSSTNSEVALAGLTNLAQQQSEELNEALGEIQDMVDSAQTVVANTELVQVAVQQANKTVESGDAAMNRTVEAIQVIRETVAQTSKKIKRLSESSQKISKVVNLISNFATQTNVLALNAAIEATRAGEYGKGFAVVAEEVRSLSRQSAAATIEIEKLVQEIQQETGEVAVAMETGIEQVVEGTSLVNETRQNLNAIVAATAEISTLLKQISEANQAQTMQSISVTTSMKDVASLAENTADEVKKITVVFQQLSKTAQELIASASKFKVN